MATGQEVKETYKSTLQDLTCNSKPLISVLTMLAEENVAHAKEITQTIEEHLAKVPTDVKLPVLYLIDCIVKNVGGPYTASFSANLANLFTSVFQVVDEKTRMEMFKLRQTWNEVFSKSKLYALDLKTNQLDPAWPVTSAPPNIHFNPKFLNATNAKLTAAKEASKPVVPVNPAILPESTLDMQQKLIIKQKQLLELQQKKLELELLQTQVKLQEQLKKNNSNNNANADDSAVAKVNHSSKQLLLKPEVAKQLLSNKKDESAKAMLAQINQRFPVTNPLLAQKQAAIPPKMNNAAIAIRPAIRDPRLIRQQQTEQLLMNPPAPMVPLGPLHQQLENAITSVTDNKVNNKISGRESRFDTIEQKNKINSRIPLKSKRSSSPTKSKSSSSRHNKSSGSSSSLDSPSKSSRSSSQSPSKSTKSSYKSKSSRSSDKRSKRSDRRSPKKDKSLRNYRRERAISISPEPPSKGDDDGKIAGPPEKQAKHDKDLDSRKCEAIGSKKRLSSENADAPSSKKNRAEIFDALFGTRKSSNADRPVTPPAPIISNKPKESIEKENTNGSQEPEAVPKLSLEVLRAKLANATNANKDYLQKSRLQAQAEQQKQKLAKMEENKIFITSAEEESIKSGKMTKAQETSLFGKVIAQIESHKIKEAKRKENEENLNSMMTQPISDDEFDPEVDSKKQPTEIPPGAMVVQKHTRFEPIRFNPQWRGMKRGGFPLNRGGLRGRADPWMRPIHQGPLWNPPMIGAPPVYDEITDITIDPNAMDVVNNSPPQSAMDDVCMSHENIKSINIDGEPRDILFYGETAIAFMSPDDPREISFQAGQRRVSFDDMHSYVLTFNDPYRDVLIAGHCHRVRLGAPTREIYIDGKPYECIFGGPPIAIELDRKLVMVHIDGPAPQVKIGTVKRNDLVAGKVNLIIDAKTIVPIYLDARTQMFEVNGTLNTLRFKDALKTVLINDQPYNLEFGGLPKGVMVNGRKHFIRFSVLPKGIRAGYVNIRDMEGEKALPLSDNENSQDGMDLNIVNNSRPQPIVQRPRKSRFSDSSPDHSQQNPILNLLQQPSFGNLDSLLSIASSVLPTIAPRNTSSYQIEQPSPAMCPPMIEPTPQVPPITSTPQLPPINTTVPPPHSVQPPPAINNSVLNINDLFQKLVATGIVTTLQNPPSSSVPAQTEITPVASPKMPQHEIENVPKHNKPEVQIKPVSFDDTNSLKVRQPVLIQELYTGMQCSSCGMRFAQESSSLYSQHLDWHFRQNRKGKKNIRKASSRKWYYSIADWSNYEEIENLEEREKCYFENQQKEQTEGQNEENEGEIEIPSVPTDSNVPDPRCEVCQEKFEQFYNEEKEEWHLRMAMRIEDKTYHPLCYEDYQASLLNVTLDESFEKSGITSDIEMKPEIKTIPGLDVEPDEPPVVIDFDSSGSKSNSPKPELQETDKAIMETKTETQTDNSNTEDKDEPMDADDDDVIINEVEPVKIVLDDYEYDENGLIAGVVVKQEPVDDGFTDIENFRLGTPEVPEDLNTSQDEAFVDIGVISEPEVPTVGTPTMDETAKDGTTEEANQPLATPEIDENSMPAALSNIEPLLTVPTIDGNLDCNAGVVPLPTGGMSGKIKINISKPLPVIAPKENKDNTSDVDNNIEPVDPNQPLPPGEEPVHLHLKPALQGIDLKQLPPVNKGSELTGLCSIM